MLNEWQDNQTLPAPLLFKVAGKPIFDKKTLMKVKVKFQMLESRYLVQIFRITPLLKIFSKEYDFFYLQPWFEIGHQLIFKFSFSYFFRHIVIFNNCMVLGITKFGINVLKMLITTFVQQDLQIKYVFIIIQGITNEKIFLKRL